MRLKYQHTSPKQSFGICEKNMQIFHYDRFPSDA